MRLLPTNPMQVYPFAHHQGLLREKGLGGGNLIIFSPDLQAMWTGGWETAPVMRAACLSTTTKLSFRCLQRQTTTNDKFSLRNSYLTGQLLIWLPQPVDAKKPRSQKSTAGQPGQTYMLPCA